MSLPIEDFETLMNEIKKIDGVKHAGILDSNGNIIISHFPRKLVDMVQSLILYLGIINIYSAIAKIRDFNIGISRLQDYFLVIIGHRDIEDLRKALDLSVEKFKKCLEKGLAKEREVHIKVYSGPLKTPPQDKSFFIKQLLEVPQQVEMTVFSIPVKKIFTLEFLNNKMSEELRYKYGDWVVDLFIMIDGEKNIAQLTKILKRDISEVIMVIEELIKNRAVAIKRLKFNSM